MLTRQDAHALYRAGEDTVVRVLLEMDARIQALERQVQDLTARLDASEHRVRQLEEQVAKDSHNSSKPPSSDGLAKPKPKSLRPPSARPTGGQPGHPGRTLRMVEQPDRTVHHPVQHCAGCGRSLAQQAPDRVERRQVFDLPEPTLEVTEHQADVTTCACGCVNRAAFPPEVTAPVQYDLRVKSVAVYLKDYQLLPFERLTEIMRDLFACETFSEGMLANLGAACARRLAPVLLLRIVDAGYVQNPVPEPPPGPTRRGRRKQTKARNLLDRFRDHPDGILAFMRDFKVPFDNNLSERDLRMMKLRQKISGTFRNVDALVDFCRIRGYVSTARKNGLNALDALRRVFAGDPFVPAVNTS